MLQPLRIKSVRGGNLIEFLIYRELCVLVEESKHGSRIYTERKMGMFGKDVAKLQEEESLGFKTCVGRRNLEKLYSGDFYEMI